MSILDRAKNNPDAGADHHTASVIFTGLAGTTDPLVAGLSRFNLAGAHIARDLWCPPEGTALSVEAAGNRLAGRTRMRPIERGALAALLDYVTEVASAADDDLLSAVAIESAWSASRLLDHAHQAEPNLRDWQTEATEALQIDEDKIARLIIRGFADSPLAKRAADELDVREIILTKLANRSR